MDFEITISDDNTYIMGKVNVSLTRKVIIELTQEYVKLYKKTGIKRIISDFRDAPNVMGTTKEYNFAHSDIPSIGFPRDIRVAVVIAKGDTSHKFSETVAVNVGYQVETFHSFNQAVEWLLKDT